MSEAVRTAAVLDLMTVGRETTASARKTSVSAVHVKSDAIPKIELIVLGTLTYSYI